MDQRTRDYFERRAMQERAIAERSSDEVVRRVHESFASHYAEQVAATRIARMTVDDLLG